MIEGLLGRKIGMTQVFGATGEVIPVTVLEGSHDPAAMQAWFAVGADDVGCTASSRRRRAYDARERRSRALGRSAERVPYRYEVRRSSDDALIQSGSLMPDNDAVLTVPQSSVPGARTSSRRRRRPSPPGAPPRSPAAPTCLAIARSAPAEARRAEAEALAQEDEAGPAASAPDTPFVLSIPLIQTSPSPTRGPPDKP